MKPALEELCVELEAAAIKLRGELEERRWDAARELARRMLSAASKLHARCGLLLELEADASWAAEVDRAVKRERLTRPEAVAGDQPLFDGEGKPTTPGRKPTPRRKA